MSTVKCSDIAGFLSKTLVGLDVDVEKPTILDSCGAGDLVWVKSFSQQRLETLEKCRPALVICDRKTAEKTTISHIPSDNPRLDFIRTLRRFFYSEPVVHVHPTAMIEKGAKIGERASIGAYAHIGREVSLGNDCFIGSGVVIEGRVYLGDNCRIKANSVIGGQGFGFEYDENDNPIHFPHLGTIIIEDDVWIGACSTVEIGTLGATRICRGCKVDDLVQVGHNVTLGRNTLVMANSVICGGALVGEKCWIAPNSVVKEKVRIGNNVTVGLGSVVIRDVESGNTVAGVPAQPLERRTG